MGRGNAALRALGGLFKGAYAGMGDWDARQRQQAALDLQERRVQAMENAALHKQEAGTALQQNMTALGFPLTQEGYAAYLRSGKGGGGGGGGRGGAAATKDEDFVIAHEWNKWNQTPPDKRGTEPPQPSKKAQMSYRAGMIKKELKDGIE